MSNFALFGRETQERSQDADKPAMLTAIGGAASARAYAASAEPSGRALDADLARCEVRLSDWTHCVSAKTPQGKEKIAEIGARVDAIKAKMKAAEQVGVQAPAGVGVLGYALNVFA